MNHDSHTQVSVGIDLGGTRIKAVALGPGGALLQQRFLVTEEGGKGWKESVRKLVEDLTEAAGDPEVSVGISAPGIPGPDHRTIDCMPGRLQGLEGFCWSEWLQRPAWVLNDAIAALMAEARWGAAKGRRHVVLLTIGTGVGGGLLLDGRPYLGAFRKAGHLGHLSLDSEETPDITGIPGSLEDAIGNHSLPRRSGGRYTDTLTLLEDLRRGEVFAHEIWMKSVRQLAVGMASLSNVLSPECFVLSGGITLAGEDLFAPLEQFYRQYEWRPGGRGAQILRAVFGDLAGAIGAAVFAGWYPEQSDISELR